ncbi:hypothetical protein FOZ62_012505, partial [Perkinsus olseni]
LWIAPKNGRILLTAVAPDGIHFTLTQSAAQWNARYSRPTSEVYPCLAPPADRLAEWDENSVYGRLYGDAMKRFHARIEGSPTAPPDSSHDAGRRSFTEHMADSIMRV